jgi:putative ABC transport system substrate-binding protein
MRLRCFRLIALLLCLVAPIGGGAQESGRVYRVGYLQLGTPEGGAPLRLGVIRDSLRALGYVEGRNLVIVMRDGGGDATRLAGAAEALVAAKIDVILTTGTGPTLAAKRATRDIPIVFGTAADPVGRGIVASLAHPGGNVTGFVAEITPTKNLELLKDVVPTVRRVGFLYHEPNIPPNYRATFLEERTSAARALGMELIPRPVREASDFDGAFADLASQSVDAAFINQDALHTDQRVRVAALALRHRLPTVCHDRLMAEAGCLVSYGEDLAELHRRAVGYVDKILKGARPADLPVEQPTKFALLLNARTATALGLAFPPAIFANADEVIE